MPYADQHDPMDILDLLVKAGFEVSFNVSNDDRKPNSLYHSKKIIHIKHDKGIFMMFECFYREGTPDEMFFNCLDLDLMFSEGLDAIVFLEIC